MPVYEFECVYCQITFEVKLGISDDHKIGCLICGKTAEKTYKPIAVHFKGTGWGKD